MAYYAAGWSTHETPMSVLIAGAVAGTATIPAGYFSHVEIGDGGIAGQAYYDTFPSTVETALNTDVAAGFTVTRSATTGLYTVSRGSGTFSLNFGVDESTAALGRALGFASSFYAAALSHTSDATPYYMIATAISARSPSGGRDLEPYEPDDLVDETVSDGGVAHGIASESVEIWRDWTQQMESKEATFEHAALASAPWTWQHFFRHCRATHPFTVLDAIADVDGARIFTLRAEGAAFTSDVRQPVDPDVDDLWVLEFHVRDHGDLP